MVKYQSHAKIYKILKIVSSLGNDDIEEEADKYGLQNYNSNDMFFEELYEDLNINKVIARR